MTFSHIFGDGFAKFSITLQVRPLSDDPSAKAFVRQKLFSQAPQFVDEWMSR